jgi:hypothetical protein
VWLAILYFCPLKRARRCGAVEHANFEQIFGLRAVVDVSLLCCCNYRQIFELIQKSRTLSYEFSLAGDIVELGTSFMCKFDYFHSTYG